MQVALEVVRMKSQPNHNFKATQAVHRADDIMILNFLTECNWVFLMMGHSRPLFLNFRLF